jgi:NADH-quinone oxidoreductase subunit M
MPHHLSILVWLPAAAALGLVAVSSHRTRLIRASAVAGAVSTLAVALPLWFAYQPRASEWQFVEHLDIVRPLGMSYALGLDGLSLSLVLLTTVIAAATLLSLSASAEDRLKHRCVAVLLLEAALLGAFLALDLLLWSACITIALAAMWRLTRADDDAAEPSKGLTLGLAAAGGLLLAALATMSGAFRAASGAFSFDLRALQQAGLAAPAQLGSFAALVLGFAAAAGAFVVHARSIERRAAATLPASWVCAIVVLNLAAYAFLRVSFPVLPDASRRVGPAVGAMFLAAGFAAAIAAIGQTRWTRVIVFASLGQICLAVAGVFTLTPAGLTAGIVHQIAHGLALAALLVAARGSDAASVAGRRMLPALLSLAAALQLASLPVSGGFVGSRLIVEGAWPVSRVTAVLASVAMLLVAAGVLAGARRIFVERGTALFPSGARGASAWIAAVLLAASIGLGAYASPLLWRVETAVARVVLRVSPQFAADVADCLSQPPPTPEQTGLPAGMVMAAPCEEGKKP